MQLLKYLGLMLCGFVLLSCNGGSTTSSNPPLQPVTMTLTDGTTITIPSINLYVPESQTLQVPITIVGGNFAGRESLVILASLVGPNQTANADNPIQKSFDYSAPVVSTSLMVTTVYPHKANIIYLNINDLNGATGTYSISLTVRDTSTNTITTFPRRIVAFILENICSSVELQSCNKNRCYAYVNPATASLNQNNYLQYNAIAIIPDGDNCYADITGQTTWISAAESIASIDTSGQATAISLGNTFINAGSNTYNINYLWSSSPELNVVPAVQYPGGYGNLSITNLSDVTYSCSNGLNKPIYLKVNNGTGILNQVVYGWAWLNGYLVYVKDLDIRVKVGDNGYGEALAFIPGHPFSLNVRECQKTAPYYINLTYGATVNGYTYPELSYPLQVKVID